MINSNIKPYDIINNWDDFTIFNMKSQFKYMQFKADTVIVTIFVCPYMSCHRFTYWVKPITNQPTDWAIELPIENPGNKFNSTMSEYLRIIATFGVSVVNLVEKYTEIESIEFNTYDASDDIKSAQKRRIYADLLRTNTDKLNEMGFVNDINNQIPCIIRKRGIL